jgi:hypothetical protein
MDTTAKQKVNNELCAKTPKRSDYTESCSTNCYSWKESAWSMVCVLYSVQFQMFFKRC